MAYAVLNGRMITNELRKDMEGSGHGLFQDFIEGTEEKHEKTSRIAAKHQPRFKAIS
jgi:hypothetical protein